MVAEGSPIEFVKMPTRQLRFLMGHYQKINTPREFGLFVDYMREMAAKYCSELEKHPPGRERALAAIRLVDDVLIEAERIPASCAKGCAHCCRLEVEITQDEVELLADLVEEGRSFKLGRLLPDSRRDKRCIFLTEDNICNIYEHRPNTCRKLRVVSPPNECEIAAGKPHPITVPLAELIISVALSLPGNGPVALSKGLAKKLGENSTL